MSVETGAREAVTIDRPTDLLVEDRDGIRILSLSRGKVNAISTDFAHALHNAALLAQDDASIRGVVLTSTNPKVFSAGFDLRKLAQASDEDFARFVRVFDSLFFDLFLLGKPLVVALTGHAVAGGALLASTADFRLAAEGPGTIGLPEVTLGIHVPRHYLEAMRTTVGEQALTRWALLGETMPFTEARDLGAIDRIVPSDRLVEEAVAFARRLGGASSEVYAAIKRDLRGSAVEHALDIQPDARKAFVESWFSETGQRGLARALAR
ncbi:MAG TPA: enoyl-CoA hydratase/isomerase family protein [Thermoanaerobaculia bacterium]|nr:enoyl-CoA hydratase/isomerase family protein [Thermoanaerobaculia bacterium]